MLTDDSSPVSSQVMYSPAFKSLPQVKHCKVLLATAVPLVAEGARLAVLVR